MKKTYLHNNNKNKKIVVFVVVITALFVFWIGRFSGSISNPAIIIARPFLFLSNSVGNWFSGIGYVFHEKGKLQDENIDLKNKLKEVEIKLISSQMIENQNKELKEILSYKKNVNYLAAGIIVRPPKSPYDTMIIDAGSDNGIQVGMQVTAYSDILLGYVTEVFSKTSKIKLISFPNEEINVYLQNSKLSAIAVGDGGGNFKITLPRSVEVQLGDNVITTGMNPLLIGIVDKVKIDITDAFQEVLFSLPANIQDLKYVMIQI